MALTDLTRISTSGIATGTSLSGAILHGDAHFRGTQVGVTSALFDSSDNALEFNDNVKIKLGNSGDLQIYHSGTQSVIQDTGTGPIKILTDNFRVRNGADNENLLVALQDEGVKAYYNNNLKFQTTQTGAIVTGILTATGFSGPLSNPSGISTFYDLRVTNNLTVEGTTSTLDTTLIGVDRVEVGANSNSIVGVAVTQSGTADLVNLFDGATKVVTVDDVGNVGLGTDNPDRMLHIKGTGNAIVKMEANYSGSVTGIEGVLTASGANRYVTGVYGKVVNTSGSESNVASIRLWNEQASPTTSDSPGYITFNTTNDGASTATEKLRITSGGDVGINVTPISGVKLQVGTPGSATGVFRAHPDYFSIDSGHSNGGGGAGAVGSASNPSLIFGGDGNTGLYHSASDTLNFTTGGSERLRITSTGEVNIGGNFAQTTYTAQITSGTANKKIGFGAAAHNDLSNEGSGIFFSRQSDGSDGLSGIFAHTNSSLGIAARTDITLHAGGTSTYGAAPERLRIKSNGNTGINNTNPQRILHIGESGTAEANIRIQGGADYGEIRVKDSDNNLSFHHNVGGAGSRELFNSNGSTGHFSINCYTYQALTITTNENGTNGPEIQLMHNSASPAANDTIGQIRYSGKDSAGDTTLYSKIETKVLNATNGSEAGHLDFSTRGGGAYNSIFRLNARSTASAPSYTTDDMNGIILDTYNTGNPYPRYFNFIAKSAGNTDSNITFWTESVGGSPTEKLRIASDGVATFSATNINVNRNAGDAFIALQTSGTSNVSLYGGASSGFRVFTKPSGGSLTERLRVANDGGTIVNKGGSPNAASGWAGLEVKAAASEHQLVLSSTDTASNSNQVRLGFKLHPSNDNERVKAAIVCQGSGGGYGEVSRMMFCIDSAADNGNALPNSASDEKLRITSSGLIQIGGDISNVADIDTSNTKLTIKQSANSQEDGIYIERSGERRGHYIYVGGAHGTNDALCFSTNQLGTDTDILALDRSGAAYLGGSFYPNGDANHDIGSEAKTWRKFYIRNMYPDQGTEYRITSGSYTNGQWHDTAFRRDYMGGLDLNGVYIVTAYADLYNAMGGNYSCNYTWIVGMRNQYTNQTLVNTCPLLSVTGHSTNNYGYSGATVGDGIRLGTRREPAASGSNEYIVWRPAVSTSAINNTAGRTLVFRVQRIGRSSLG